jgi:tripartite ATP-independent transporter DctM subunit
MSPFALGLIGIVFLLLAFAFGIPVAYAMGIVGFSGLFLIKGLNTALSTLSRDFFKEFNSYALTCIPMFVLMGTLASHTGISRRLYSTAYKLVGSLRGGLAMATILSCAAFAAMCGSSGATAASMGKITLPEMKRYNYSDTLATGSVASAGTLGILIPPSVVLIVYGLLTMQSIGELFIAGILPGLLVTLLFILVINVICYGNPALGPPGNKTRWKDKVVSLSGFTDALILFLLVLGGLLLGWFGPTQAGAIGAAGALVIGIGRRELSVRGFIDSLADALCVSAMILCIIAGATVFGHFMTISTIPAVLARWLNSLDLPPLAMISFIVLTYLLGGCFMDSLPLVILTVPIFYPTIVTYGFDPIWFGIVIVLVTEMGVITPPVGVNVYIIKGIAQDVPLINIFRVIFPFLIALIVAAVLLIIFPQISMFLPGLIAH